IGPRSPTGADISGVHDFEGTSLSLGPLKQLPSFDCSLLLLSDQDFEYLQRQFVRIQTLHIDQHNHTCALLQSDHEIGANTLLTSAVANGFDPVFITNTESKTVHIFRTIRWLQRSPHQV